MWMLSSYTLLNWFQYPFISSSPSVPIRRQPVSGSSAPFTSRSSSQVELVIFYDTSSSLPSFLARISLACASHSPFLFLHFIYICGLLHKARIYIASSVSVAVVVQLNELFIIKLHWRPKKNKYIAFMYIHTYVHSSYVSLWCSVMYM